MKRRGNTHICIFFKILSADLHKEFYHTHLFRFDGIYRRSTRQNITWPWWMLNTVPILDTIILKIVRGKHQKKLCDYRWVFFRLFASKHTTWFEVWPKCKIRVFSMIFHREIYIMFELNIILNLVEKMQWKVVLFLLENRECEGTIS